jgi:hypothetical protein
MTVEILTGRKVSYSWPTVVKDLAPAKDLGAITYLGLDPRIERVKKHYEIITGPDFLNTRPEELPLLPAMFVRPPPKRTEFSPSDNYVDADDLSEKDREAYIHYYVHDCQYTGASAHDRSRAMARLLAGVRCSPMEIERYVQDRIRHEGNEGRGRELTDKAEAKRIAEYGLKNPLYAPPVKTIRGNRMNTLRALTNKMIGGKPQ